MLPDSRFLNLPKTFWANVRTISEARGYTARGTKQIKVHCAEEMLAVMRSLNLGTDHLYDAVSKQPTELCSKLEQYFNYRADILNDFVKARLMNAERAKEVYDSLVLKCKPTWPVPMNKQKGKKRAPAYLTGIVNIFLEATCKDVPGNCNPQALTTFTRAGSPLRTLARRVDGCFPSTVNPIAVWEIKEYYYTTTFGSRVADGVYETLLDGMELEELRDEEGVDVHHLLVVDAYYTWWEKGRSYLCRLVDMLHMGYVDEILVGYEVVEEMPRVVQEWVRRYRRGGF